MDTVDLTSYYDDYCEGAKVPFEDYRILEDKIEIYDKGIEKIKSILEEKDTSKQKIKYVATIIAEMGEELERC